MITLLDDGDLTAEWYNAAIGTKAVGCDIETSGLDSNKDRIATFQMHVPEYGTVMVRNLVPGSFPKHLLQLMENKRLLKIFHHAPFDLRFLTRDYYYMFPTRIACTKIAADLVDRGKKRYVNPDTGKGSHSLKALVYYHFDYRMDKTLAISDWFAERLDEKQLEYAAKDVEYLPALLNILEEELKAMRLLPLARKAYERIATGMMLELKNGD